MLGQTNTAMPAKPMVILVAGVLLAHLVVLQGTSLTLSLNEPAIAKPMVVRAVQLLPSATTDNAVAAPSAPQKRPAANPAAPAKPADTTPDPVFKQERASSADPVADDQNAAKTAVEELPPALTAADAEPAPSPATEPKTAGPDSPNNAAMTAQTFVMPVSSRLQYDVTGGKDGLTYSARAELLWVQDSVKYTARMEVSAFLIGSRVRTSSGRLTADGLAPDRFSDKSRSELAAHFDREKGRITFSNGPEAPLLARAQDQLSLFIQLGAMLAGEPEKYVKGTRISIQTVGPRAAEMWVLIVEEAETLQLPGGALATVKLVRNPRREYDQKAELWLAPSQGYFPVRLKVTQPNGDYVDQQWRATEVP